MDERGKMRILGAIFFVMMYSVATAQVAIKNPSTELYNKCLSEAIADNDVRSAGSQSSYSCYGATARSWYELLTGEKAVHDKNGLFVARYYGDTGYCAHQIEDPAGKPVSIYVCEIVTNAPN
jgi:hypothetical protein